MLRPQSLCKCFFELFSRHVRWFAGSRSSMPLGIFFGFSLFVFGSAGRAPPRAIVGCRSILMVVVRRLRWGRAVVRRRVSFQKKLSRRNQSRDSSGRDGPTPSWNTLNPSGTHVVLSYSIGVALLRPKLAVWQVLPPRSRRVLVIW